MSPPRHTMHLATVLVALAACAPKAPDTAADAAALKAGALMWFDHFNAGDADGVASMYAEDGVLLPPGAPAAVGPAAIRDFIASEIAGAKSAGLTVKGDEVTDVAVAGDVAWVFGTFSVTDASGATVDKGKYVTTHRRVDGKWPLFRDIWNSDMPPPAAAPPLPTAPVR